MSGMRDRRAATLAIIAVPALIGAAPAATARSLEDTVKLAVIKEDAAPNFKDNRDAGKKISAYWDYYTGKGYTFGSFRLMSLVSDDVCGSFKRSDGSSADFYYDNGNVFIEATHRKIVQSFCHEPHKTTLAGDRSPWRLSCIDDSSDGLSRRCYLAAPLSADGDEATLAMVIVKRDRSHVIADFVLGADAPRGRLLAMTMSGEETSCALVPYPGNEGLFLPCNVSTSQRLVENFLRNKVMTVKFGDRAWEFAGDEPRHLWNAAERYFLAFPGGEHM